MHLGTLASINLSDGGVPKLPVSECEVTANGLEGDRQRDPHFHGGPGRAVCLFSLERIQALQAEGHPIDAGTTGENFTVSGLDWDEVVPGTALRVGEVTLEVTNYTHPCANIAGSFEDGAGGYLLKDGTDTDIAESIVRLVAGEAPISPAIAAHLIRRLRPKPEPAQQREAHDPSSILTDRETEVLQLVAKGLSYQEIGEVLQLRYHTIASYIKGIYRKLAVRSRGEAVFEARQMGLLD